jgi:hypothetical protein
VWYKNDVMAIRRIVMLLVVLMVVLAPPLAMALSDCAGMSADCEGPCGSTTALSRVPVRASIPGPSWPTELAAIPHAPAAPARLVDLPPRP